MSVIQSFILEDWRTGTVQRSDGASGPNPNTGIGTSGPNVGVASTFTRQGVMFARGDVPAGSAVQIKRGTAVVPAQFDERVTWPDGSLKFAVMHLRDAPFALAENRKYDIETVPGVLFNNLGIKTVSDITMRYLFTVLFDHLTQTNGVRTATVGSGAFIASFNAHAKVPTRVEKYHSGPVCEGWIVWGMATDKMTGAADAHLKTVWYADIWKYANGMIAAIEIGAVVAQDWWSVPGKERRDYRASFHGNGTLLQSYIVGHPYQSQWLTCQNSGGFNRGRRHWVGGVAPSLGYKPDKSYWISTGLIPPYDLTAPVANPPVSGAVYVPCEAQDHRAAIDATGGYMGRGLLPNSDVLAFLRQTPESVAAARINAHAGLHVFFHYRSNRQRQRPADARTDVANTPISMILGISDGTAPMYDFRAYGMPPPVHAYADARSSPAGQDGFIRPTGGGGVWNTQTGDSSHAVNYCGFMYMLEGERYHLEALLDLATNGTHQGIDNIYYGRPYLTPYASTAVRAIANPPSTTYDGIANLNLQERAVGWSLNLTGAAAGLIPDWHVAARFMRRFARQQAIYLRDCLKWTPPDMIAAGVMAHMDVGYTSVNDAVSPWMVAIAAQGSYQNHAMTGDADIRAWADMLANMSINMVRDGCYLTEAYRAINKPKRAPIAADNRYTIHPRVAFGIGATVANGRLVWTGNFITPAFDDVLYPGPGGPPPGTPVYVVGGGQVSLYPGGAPIVFAPTLTWIDFDAALKAYDVYPVAVSPPYLPDADSFAAMHHAAMVMAHRAGYAAATPALAAKQTLFLSKINTSTWRTWLMG